MRYGVVVLAAALAASAVAAQANEVYDQTVPSEPSGGNAGNMYFGSGNKPINFATNSGTDGAYNVSIGLNAAWAGSYGYKALTAPSGTYYVTPGYEQTGPASYSSSHPTWDYDFSIDLGEGSGNTFANYTALLTVKNDTTGLTQTYNPLLLPDNDEAGSTPEGPTDGLIQQNGESATYAIVQPSVYAGVNSRDKYTITLSLADTANPSFGLTDTINVATVPLPATASCGLALLAGLGLFGGIKRLRSNRLEPTGL